MLEVNMLINQIMPFSVDSSDSKEKETDTNRGFQSILENIEKEYSIMKKQYIDSDTEENDIEFDEKLDVYKEILQVINTIAELFTYIKLNYEELDNNDLTSIYGKLNETQEVLGSIHFNKESMYFEKGIESLFNLLGQLKQIIEITGPVDHILVDGMEKEFEEISKNLINSSDIQSLRNEGTEFEKGKNEHHLDEAHLNKDTKHLNLSIRRMRIEEEKEMEGVEGGTEKKLKETLDLQNLSNEGTEFEEDKNEHHLGEAHLNKDTKHLNLSIRRMRIEEEKEMEGAEEGSEKKLKETLDLQNLSNERIEFEEGKYEHQKNEVTLDNETEYLNLNFEGIRTPGNGEETVSNTDSNRKGSENDIFQDTAKEYSNFFNILANDVANADNDIETILVQDFNREELIQQLVEKFEIIKNQDKQEVKIKLKPDYLGELVLKMESENGAIVAKLIVDNIRTKEIIESGLFQLKEQFENNGLEIKAFDVFIGSNEEFEGEKRNRYNFVKSQTKLKFKNSLVEELDLYNISFENQNAAINYEGRLNLFV